MKEVGGHCKVSPSQWQWRLADMHAGLVVPRQIANAIQRSISPHMHVCTCIILNYALSETVAPASHDPHGKRALTGNSMLLPHMAAAEAHTHLLAC